MMPSVKDELHWYEKAACRYTDINVFYPEANDSPLEALTLCSSCPVRTRCLAEALRRDDRYGIWGGLTPKQRIRIRRREIRSARDERAPGAVTSGGL